MDVGVARGRIDLDGCHVADYGWTFGGGSTVRRPEKQQSIAWVDVVCGPHDPGRGIA